MKKTSNKFKWYLYGLAVVLTVAVIFQPDSHEQQLINVSRKTLPKTVMIEVAVEEPMLTVTLGDVEIYRSTQTVTRHYLGSGVFVSPNGHVLTCGHLFTNGLVKAVIITRYDGSEQFGEVLNVDARRDLALVKVFTRSPFYARLANPRKLQVGQEVIAIGNPLALDFTVTHGIISYLNRDFKFAYNVTQSDTFINPGNSGGPLFNLKGELVGINSFLISPVNAAIFTACGFSVQVGQIIEFLAKYKDIEKALK